MKKKKKKKKKKKMSNNNNNRPFLNIPDQYYANFFGKMAYGFGIGGLIGLIALRGGTGRLLCTTFGTGAGAGIGWYDYRKSIRT